jgi:hypothetical protein
MMKYVFFCIGIFGGSLQAQTLRPEFMIFNIPDSLKKGANAVVREYEYRTVVDAPGKAITYVRQVVTVFNDKNKDYLIFQSYEDEFQKVRDIEVKLYDALGFLEKEVKRKDLQEEAIDDGFSLATSGKVVYAAVYPKTYPATVEMSYEIKHKGILEYNDFRLQRFGVSIQKATYTISSGEDNPVRYNTLHSNIKPVAFTDKKMTTLSWSIKNVPAVDYEAHNVGEVLPVVQIAPSRFEMDNYGGDMSTWKSFGLWKQSLIGENNVLSNDYQRVVQSLVNGMASEKEKIKKVYHFLQDNYRYVSIQLGIGGWRPFPANFVHEKKYGDCKALSNYMHAGLKAVGINSYYAVVQAGRDFNTKTAQFANSNFNHIILCVPNNGDTVWLECTSKDNYPGILGSFTENRQALLVTEHGGVLVNTPKSKSSNNQINCKNSIAFDEEKNATIQTSLFVSGDYNGQFDYLVQSDEMTKRRILAERWGFKQADEFAVENQSEKHAMGRKANVLLKFERLHDFNAGSKHFFPKHPWKMCLDDMDKNEKRRFNFGFEHLYEKSDTTVFQLGDLFVLETVPAPVEIKHDFGSYRCEVIKDEVNKTVTTITTFKLVKQFLEAKDYVNVYNFIEAVKKEETQKLVLKKL